MYAQTVYIGPSFPPTLIIVDGLGTRLCNFIHQIYSCLGDCYCSRSICCVLLFYPSQLVDCAPTQCDFTGGAVIPAGEDECCPTCGCMSGGTTYRVGESFPAGDGCNGW